MATYIVLGQFTDQGIKNVKDTTKRAQSFADLVTRAGGTMKDIYWTLGEFDLVTIIEAPDDATMTGLLLTVGGLGNIRTHSLRAFSSSEMSAIVGKMG